MSDGDLKICPDCGSILAVISEMTDMHFTGLSHVASGAVELDGYYKLKRCWYCLRCKKNHGAYEETDEGRREG